MCVCVCVKYVCCHHADKCFQHSTRSTWLLLCSFPKCFFQLHKTSVLFWFFLQSKRWPWCCYVITRSVITTPPPPPLSPPPLYCYETEFPISLDPPALRRNRTDQTDDLCWQSPPVWLHHLAQKPLSDPPLPSDPTPPPPPRQCNKNAADGPAKTLAVGL